MGILAKRLTPDRVSIKIQERRLHALVTSPEGEPEFELDVELYDEVGLILCCDLSRWLALLFYVS